MPAGLASLPTELLARVLGCLELESRHRLAVVARRWQEAANSPALLRCLALRLFTCFEGDRELSDWFLQRAAQHVQQLKIEVHAEEASTPPDEAQWEQQAEVWGLVQGMLMACAGSGQLAGLHLELYTDSDCPFVLGAWFTALSGSLRRLFVESWDGGPVVLTANLAHMAVLGDVRLVSTKSGIHIQPPCRLPARLTKLTLGGSESDSGALAPQIISLSRLAELALCRLAYTRDGYAPLQHLHALTRLHLHGCVHVPACLGQLGSLEELLVESYGGEQLSSTAEDGATLSAALGRLTCLTRLRLEGMPGLEAPPATLTCLGCLRQLAWLQGASPEPLPPGPWLRHLQLFAAWAPAVATSMPALAEAAAALTELEVAADAEGCEQAAAVVRWAGGRHGIRRLAVGLSDQAREAPGSLPAALGEARAANPALIVVQRDLDLDAWSMPDLYPELE
ncbi:hypothetical protein ABPG75_010624 [Micractinium tetrahymenae]